MIRKIGKKVNFNFNITNSSLNEKETGIKEKFSEIKKAKEILEKIQKNPLKGIVGKEKQIKQMQIELKKIIDSWKDLSKINFDELGREELINLGNSQKNFITDLLKHYLILIKKEKEYLQKIKRI